MATEKDVQLHKIIVVGAEGAGKSALTQTFMYGVFVEDYDPTTADSYRKPINSNGEKCLIDILDTAGQEEYLRDNYYKLAGFMIVYSICERSTFDATARFYDHILQVKGKEVPIILVGSKCDLEKWNRDVKKDEGTALAQKWNCPFYETSSKTHVNVDDVFITLAGIVAKHKAQNGQESPTEM